MAENYFYVAFRSVGGPGVSRQTVEDRYKIYDEVDRKNEVELKHVLEKTSSEDAGIEILKDVTAKLSFRSQSSERILRESLQRRESHVRQTAQVEHTQTNSVDLDSRQRPGLLQTCVDVKFLDATITFVVHSSSAPITLSQAITTLRVMDYDYSFWLEAAAIIPHNEMPTRQTCKKKVLNVPIRFLREEVRPAVRMLELNEVSLEVNRQVPGREHVTSLFNDRQGPHDKWFSDVGKLKEPICINVSIRGEPKKVVGYMLQTANDAPERDPKSWILRGRPSKGNKEWRVLHEMTNFDKFKGRWECARFDLDVNLPEMEALQLEILDVHENNGRGAQLGQFRIFVPEIPTAEVVG